MNWANGLTVGRLILGPIVLVCLMLGRVRLAFYLFLVAMMTDVCDGYLARWSGRVTDFGRLMDPLADKVLVSLVLAWFLFVGLPYVPLWMVVVIVGREVLILGWRTGALRSGEGFITSRIAKLKTASQMAWIASVLLYMTVLSRARVPLGTALGGTPEIVLWIFGCAVVVLTIASGAQYVLAGGAAEARGSAAGAEPGERG